MFRNQTVLRVPLPHILLEVTLSSFFSSCSRVIVLFALFVVFFPVRPLRQTSPPFRTSPSLRLSRHHFCLLSQKLCPRISEPKTPFLPCRWVFGLCKRCFFSLSLSSLARHSAEAPHRNRLYNTTNKYPTYDKGIGSN